MSFLSSRALRLRPRLCITFSDCILRRLYHKKSTHNICCSYLTTYRLLMQRFSKLLKMTHLDHKGMFISYFISRISFDCIQNLYKNRKILICNMIEWFLNLKKNKSSERIHWFRVNIYLLESNTFSFWSFSFSRWRASHFFLRHSAIIFVFWSSPLFASHFFITSAWLFLRFSNSLKYGGPK